MGRSRPTKLNTRRYRIRVRDAVLRAAQHVQEPVSELVRVRETFDAVENLAVLEQDDRGERLHPELARDVRVLLGVDLHERHLVASDRRGELREHLLAQELARTAPRSVKVHEHGDGGLRDHVVETRVRLLRRRSHVERATSRRVVRSPVASGRHACRGTNRFARRHAS